MFAVIESLTPHLSAQVPSPDHVDGDSASRKNRPAARPRRFPGASCATSAGYAHTQTENRLMAPLQESSAARVVHAPRTQA